MLFTYRNQTLERDPRGRNYWQMRETVRDIDPEKTAIILCDVWDNHWSHSAVERLGELIAPMNNIACRMRDRGSFILHSPSETLGFYKDTQARKRMADALAYGHIPAIVKEIPDSPSPISAAGGGSDVWTPKERVNQWVWTRQHEGIFIDDQKDGITEDGAEAYNYFMEHGYKTLFIMGVHVNMCVMGRSFGIKNMARWGMDIALVRDMTDGMYDPAMPPYVDHWEGIRLYVSYIEKFWCPTVHSTDFLH